MINYMAVFVAAIVGYILGALWYSPLLFGKQWMSLVGLTMKDMEKVQKDGKMGVRYGVAFIAVLVMSYVLARFVGGSGSFATGAITGFWIWLGFLATTMINVVLWENKPFTLYLLQAAHYLVGLALMGGILAVW